jgi:Fe-S oxidoreductase
MSGHRAYFEQVAREAIRKIRATEVKTVVTVSPHCYDVMKRDYPAIDIGEARPEGRPAWGADFNVLHGTEYVAGLVRESRLKFTKPIPRTVTYHDPCYLSRGHGVIEPPREILRAIPGMRLVEMADHGTLTWCCGGGGGRAYQESLPNERLADERIRQAGAVKAEVLAAACPLCVTHFEDSAKVGGSSLQVKDVLELAAEAL